METAFKPIFDWITQNWVWAITFIGVFFEITPVKIHPISALLGWLGKRLNGDIKKDVAELKRETKERFNTIDTRMSETEKQVDMQRMANIKTLVLDFANSCRNGRKHSKEEFTHILSENSVYEELVEKYKIKNDVYKEDYRYIKEIYADCQRENKFLA